MMVEKMPGNKAKIKKVVENFSPRILELSPAIIEAFRNP